MQKQNKDPVCGTDVNAEHCEHKRRHHQKEYCFCSQQCMAEFNKNPDKYAK